MKPLVGTCGSQIVIASHGGTATIGPRASATTQTVKKTLAESIPQPHKVQSAQSGRKRKASSDKVFFDGVPYATLPWFLGKVPVKSDKAKAHCGRTNVIELRNGDHNTLKRYVGEELLESPAPQAFRQHRWVSTTCAPTRKDRGPLQCKLIPEGSCTSSSNFLYKVADLQRALA